VILFIVTIIASLYVFSVYHKNEHDEHGDH